MATALEQLKQAEAFKEEGNRHHSEGNYKRALGAYHKVFCYVNGLQAPPTGQTAGDKPTPSSSSQIPQERVEDVKKLKQSTRLNMAACYLKTGDHQKCVDACTAALELGSNAKAYFRRAQAYAELRNFSGATADLERARELAPDDAAIEAELKKVRRNFMQGDAAEKKKYASMFAKAPADPRSAAQATAASPAPAMEELGEEDEFRDAAAEAIVTQPAPASAPASVPAAAEPPAEEAESKASAAEANGRSGRGDHQGRSGAADGPRATGTIVEPASSEVRDEARKLECTVRELTYAWEQTDENVKIYISFDQSEELEGGVDESRVQVEYGEWSVSLVIRSTVEGRAPLGLRLADFHRRIAPDKCRCTVRSSRITLKLVKQEKEHWWNLLQRAPIN